MTHDTKVWRELSMKPVRFLLLLLLLVMIFPVGAESPVQSFTEALEFTRYWSPASQHSPFNAVPERKDPKLVIFLYHNLVFGRTGNVYNRDIYNFAYDLAFIKRNFEVINFDDLQEIAAGDREVTTDIAIITFDDGDLSVYALAYPILAEFGLSATFFLVPSYVGTTGYMNWQQIREMNQYVDQDGMPLFSFGSHTMNHVYLGTVDADAAKYEMSVSKIIIEQMLDSDVEILALPFGSGHDKETVIDGAKDAGYASVRTSLPFAPEIGDINLFGLPALNVESYSSDELVRRTLRLLGR
jgi:peptidoglycan/xylan/chitin deacetylase (PgdA/CDA1 family)